MTQLEEPTFHSVLRKKYNIPDTLFAEGRFVGLIGDHAANLVCIGLSMNCLIVARIILTGDNMDYDLTSITPLPLVSMSYECSSQRVKVRSHFKPMQTFQLCSAVYQAEVWDNFTSFIRDLHQQEGRDVWFSTTLKCVNDTMTLPLLQPGYKHQLLPPNQSVLSSIGSFQQQHLTCSISLPTRLPSQISECFNETYSKYHSVDCLNIEFDSFVNDAPLLKEDDLNMSNNNTVVPTEISLNVDIGDKLENKVLKFVRGLLSFCKHV